MAAVMTGALLAATFAVVLTLTDSDLARSEELFRLSINDTEDIATRIEVDRKVRSGGDGSIRVTSGWPTTVNIVILKGLSIDSSHLLYRARVRSEDLSGSAYLEMWCTVDGKNYFSRGLNSLVRGTMDWQTLSTPFALKKGQVAEVIVLNVVITGAGTVWIDDVLVERQPL